MSAFEISDFHINAILSFANRDRYIHVFDGLSFSTTDDLQKMAEILRQQNTASLNHRYESQDKTRPITFHFTRPITPIEAIKACSCYDYQAGETDDYGDTQAAKLIAYIRHSATVALPGWGDCQAWPLEK
jgi:hypothetical protein